MNPWLETLGVVLLAAAGVLAGRWFSRLPKFYWMVGYFIPFAVIVVYGLATRIPALAFIPPISWMMMGRTKFAVIGIVGTL